MAQNKQHQQGYMYCTECGFGHNVYRYEIDAGDVSEGTVCQYCLIGVRKVIWHE